MRRVQENTKTERGDHGQANKLSLQTTRFYQLLTCNEKPDVHLVKEGTLKKKDRCRQIASTSVINLASHIAVVVYPNFRPVPKKWSTPKGLPKGCHKLLSLIFETTGAHAQPTSPMYLLNEDCRSQYYFVGCADKYRHNNGWSKVKEESIIDRNKDAM